MPNRCAVESQIENLSGNVAGSLFDTNWANPRVALNDASLGYSNFVGTDTGSANNYVLTVNYGAPTAYNVGMRVTFLPANSNTSTAVINVNGLGTKAIVNMFGTAVTPGDIVAGQACELEYDGTSFRILSPCASNLVNSNLFFTNRVCYDDFENISGTSFTSGIYPSRLPWLISTSGSGSLAASSIGTDATNKARSVINLASGTASGSFSSIAQGQLWPALGPLEMDLRFMPSSLPTSAQNFTFNFGLSSSSGSFATNGIYIQGTFSGASAQFFGNAISGGILTTTAGLSWSSSNMIRLKILLNAGWTSITFSAVGVAIGSAVTTNIPTGIILLPIIQMNFSNGAGANAYVDTYYDNYQYNSP